MVRNEPFWDHTQQSRGTVNRMAGDFEDAMVKQCGLRILPKRHRHCLDILQEAGGFQIPFGFSRRISEALHP